MENQIHTTGTPLHCHSPAADTPTPWCFADALDLLNEGVIIAAPEYQSIQYCNATAGRILDKFELAPDFEILKQFLDTRSLCLCDTERQQQSTLFHNNRVLALHLTPLSDLSVFIQINDITEQKRLESIAQTVNTMDNLGFIFSGIRHEIGNPLNSIKMTNSVLQKNLDNFSREDISRYIDRTSSEIARMEYLLKSLKNFSMFEKVDCSPHDLNKFLTTLLDLVKPDLQQRRINIVSTFCNAETQVSIDPRALHQAVLNILTNAADAISESSDPAITIETEIEEETAWITIRDNGCGMTEEQIAMLFQPFYTNKTHGNGLGLVITRKLLNMMQASIEICSEVNKGSVVRIGLRTVT